MLDDWDPDDYQSRQGELEFAGLDENWIEQQHDWSWFEGQVDEDFDEADDGGMHGATAGRTPIRNHVVVLKYPKACAACHVQMAVGVEAIAEHSENGWLMWHPGHETLPRGTGCAAGGAG